MADPESSVTNHAEPFQQYILGKIKEQIAIQQQNQALEDAAYAAVIAERGYYTVTIGDCWPSRRQWKSPTAARPAWYRRAVYVVKKSEGNVLYVGYSSAPEFRIGDHCGHRSVLGMAIHEAQPESSLWTVDLYPARDRRHGLALELEMIRGLQPLLNGLSR